jgi:hypothetical protein
VVIASFGNIRRFGLEQRESFVNDFGVFNINFLFIRKIVIFEWNRVFSIKKERDLFKGVALSFRINELNDDELYDNPRNKDEIELPRHIFKSNGERVSRDESEASGEKLKECLASHAKVEWESLGNV